MKRIVTTLCALAVIMVGSIPAMAAEEPPRQDASYYPISVDEYTYGELEEPRINKVYQLSLSDDPSLIPTEDFERDGLWFTLLDMTRKNEVGVDTQSYTETVTRPSKTNDMAQVLQALEAEMEVTTAEGYAGTLHLDHTSVQVKTDGYATKTNNLSATRNRHRHRNGTGERVWIYHRPGQPEPDRHHQPQRHADPPFLQQRRGRCRDHQGQFC